MRAHGRVRCVACCVGPCVSRVLLLSAWTRPRTTGCWLVELGWTLDAAKVYIQPRAHVSAYQVSSMLLYNVPWRYDAARDASERGALMGALACA